MLCRSLAVILVSLTLVVAGALLGPAAGQEAGPAPGQGIPDRLCLTGHKGQDLAGAPHGVLVKSMPGESCRACHGAGDGHVEDPWQNPMQKNATAAEKATLCLQCHQSGPDHVVRWTESPFAKEGRTCADCHGVHAASDAVLGFAADEVGNVGEAACRMCHRPVFRAFADSFHAGVLGQPGGGCEACHGGGKAHVDGARALAAGTGPANIAKEPAADACLLCHRAMPARHAEEMPVYAERRPACTVCHDVHVNRNDPLWADEGEVASERVGNAVCATCHEVAITSAEGSVHAPVVADPEKGCEVCHGPAGAHVKSGGRSRFVVNPLRQSPEAASGLCLSCHSDAPDHAKNWKGGPLATQGLSCLTCHEAHAPREAQGRPVMTEGTEVVTGQYVGTATCTICHGDAHPGIERSPHASLTEDPEAAGCESCHGPGSAHVMRGGAKEAIRNPARLPKEQRAGFCLDCHGKNSRMFAWDHGAHASAGLDCMTCHEPLAPIGEGAKKTAPELCFACHGDVRAAFALPNHHPLAAGAVGCSDCPEVHGPASGPLSVAARKEKCFTCHRDKEGPFLYEHEADRTDGCTVCHQPHGSVNRRLLTHRTTRDLCITCHTTPASHTMVAGSPFLNCLNCHGSIHGSYVDKRFFR